MQSTELKELLLLDAGNTTVKIGRVEKGKVKLTERIKTKEALKEPEKLLKLLKGKVVAAASVVEQITELLKRELESPFFLSKNSPNLPVKVEYEGEIGADRVAAMVGGRSFFESFIVVSCGTATVIDVVVESQFKGGLILPGIELMAESLKRGTSLLPKVKLEGEGQKLGKSTVSCIQRGIESATVGAVMEVKREFPELPVIATGGYGLLISKKIGGIYREELTLKGLLIAFTRGQRPPKKEDYL
ncbi:type III pantothenate kinase [Thermovibrio sp.]